MAADSPLLKEARDRFKRAAEAEETQRKTILSVKQFRSGDQWPEEVRVQRQGGAAIQGQAAQPPRPMLTIDRISQPTRQVSNSVKAANFSINVQPNGFGADDDTATIQKGLLRWIQNRARAEAPVDWAADQAAEGGIGWFRLRTDYCADGLADGRHPFDQDLLLERIQNNLSVYCDPNAKKPIKGDAKYMFVTESVPLDEFKRLYPKANAVALTEWMSTGDTDGWVTEESVRVAEYWRVEFEKQRIVELKNGTIAIGEKIPADLPKTAVLRERQAFLPRVKCSKITAVEELESYDWLGRRIPLFPIIGEELNVDGKCVLRGVIAGAMDAQRMVNYMYSGAIEAVALAPKAPLVAAAGQIEQYKDIWQNANRFNYSYLPYDPISLGGVAVPPPYRESAEAPIQAMVMMLDKSEEAIKATTGIYDPSLGNTNPREKSGRAIMALQKQSELGQSNYIDNVMTTLTECGDEMVYLLPKIYDRPGRILQILGIDDAPEQVVVGQAFKAGPNGPEVAPPEMTGQPEQAMAAGFDQFYDFSKGRYATTVTVGKSFTTKREEGAQVLGEMISANPELLKVFGDLFFRDLDVPGAQEIAERMKKMLPPEVQAGKDGEPNPQQLQQQIQQATQIVQMLTKELDAKNQVIETDQVKAQSQIQIELMRQQGDSQRTEIETASKMAIERLKLAADLLKTRATLEAKQTEAMIDAEVRQLDAQVAAAGANEDRQAIAQESDAARQHEREMSEADRSARADEAMMGRQHERTLAEQQAQQAPSE